MRITSLCYGLLLSAAAVMPMKGDEADTVAASYRMDAVEVVAFKSNKDLSAQPVAASLLPATALTAYRTAGMKELTAVVPNFYMPDYGSRLTSPVYIRGIGSRIHAPSVGLYVDGIPYFDRSSFDFDFDGIERIEVLRGPQATLYGRNAMGGIINVYTRSPFSPAGTSIGASVGNYDRRRIHLSHGGIIGGTFGYTLAAGYLHSGGYFNNITTGHRADASDGLNGRVRLGWAPMAGLTIYLSSAFEYIDQNGYPYGVVDSVTNRVQAVSYGEPSYYRRRMSNSGLTAEYAGRGFRISSQTSFQYIDGHQGIDQDFLPADRFYVHFDHRQRMFSQEFNARSEGSSRYRWQTGLFGFYNDYTQTNRIELRQAARITQTAIDNPSAGVAAYHQSTIDDLLIDGLSLTAGLRFDWEQVRLTERSQAGTGANMQSRPVVYGRDTYTQLTPRLSVHYRHTANRLFYASVSKGYKAGGFNLLAAQDTARAFKPEHSWSYEVGAKTAWFDGVLHTDLTLFYIDWRNQQVSQKLASEQGFQTRNAGHSVSRGLEASVRLQLPAGPTFQVDYGYTHARFTDYLYDEARGIDYSGRWVPMVPRNTLSASAAYGWKLRGSWLDRIDFNARYTGLGSLYWHENNALKQPYYGTLNAGVTFSRKGITLSCWGKNLTDTPYAVYSFESMGTRFAQRGRPCTFGVDLSVTF